MVEFTLQKSEPVAGIVHSIHTQIPPKAFEFADSSFKDIVLFVGGLTNGILGVGYLPLLARALAPLGFGLVQALLSSSDRGWGTSSLKKDTAELAQLVKYLRTEVGKRNIILMGHSTGCQDTIHYLLHQNPTEPTLRVNGAIFQAPVSDREAFSNELPIEELDALNEEARAILESKGANELLPQKFRELAFNTPITAYRWLSLMAQRGDDDYFSSYLTDEEFSNTLGAINVPFLLLYSGSDEFVPQAVDSNKLVDRWKEIVQRNGLSDWSQYSGIIDGATHDLGPQSNAGVDRVVNFIKNLSWDKN
ncbi:BA75_00472T0 [Komagataella pastoris]|uniref:BA75_00472T0 n=1 Tax=Komagataella pastoris TaxID=4922 RepID=A0A1B2J5I5_PICPA|nr:BA75_00472T0 [Komagataella pastoris]